MMVVDFELEVENFEEEENRDGGGVVGDRGGAWGVGRQSWRPPPA